MATYTHKPIETAPVLRRRVLEHVLRLLEDHDLDTVWTIGANIMVHVILTEIEGDPTRIDRAVDELAMALKDGARNQIARERN